MMRKFKVVGDGLFICVAELTVYHRVDCFIYDVDDCDGRSPEDMFVKLKDSDEYAAFDPENREKYELFVCMAVKWDGCCNVDFNTHYFHWCGAYSIMQFQSVWKEAYEMAAEMMGEHWQGDNFPAA